MRAFWLYAALLLQPAVQEPITLEREGQTITEVERSEYALPGQTMVDADKLEQLVDDVARKVLRPPVDAAIAGHGGIVDGKPGSRLDREALYEQLYAYFYGQGRWRAELPQISVPPRVDGELLSQIRQKPIGYYATYYNASNRNRANNVGLAAAAINNQVVFPGETFSFNRVVGKRTAEKGYVRAPIIVRGELAEGVGGGICQVSSTLFNAIDRAGLRILQRYSHSRHVAYVPPGRDATVSWGGPDFVFRNEYGQPILIRAHASYGKMQVSVYSSDAIEYKPRAVPGTSERLPEEVPAEQSDA